MRTKLALAGMAMLAAGSPLAAPAQAAVPLCQGQEVTIEAVDGTATGTDGNDVIVLRGAPDRFSAGVWAGAGDDLICVDGALREDYDRGRGAEISGGEGVDSLVVRTGRNDDSLMLGADTERVDVDLGDGFDKVRILGAGATTGTIDAGKNGGTLKIYDLDLVRLDLEDNLLTLDDVAQYEVSGFLRFFASGRRVILNGDGRRNGLTAWACRATLRGGGGVDTLQASVNNTVEDCTPRGARLFGMSGDDRLTGTDRNDVLLGGRGRDKVDGGLGTDRCRAEQQWGCER